MAVVNLVEPGDAALVVNTGYFSDRMAALLARHGASVVEVKAAPGEVPPVEEVERALDAGRFKLMTITHVDTSTAVSAPVEALAGLARSRGVLSVVDAVCSAGGEPLRMDAWGVDLVLTASQKALGVPPGLALVLAGPKAMEAWRKRTRPVASMYFDFSEWLPIHEAYEAQKPAYFATPPVNLIAALEVSLGLLLEEGMQARFERHARMAHAARAGWRALGLELLPRREADAATTLSALFYPAGIDGAALPKAIAAEGVVVAGGLHPALKAKYFRVGHMGSVGPSDVLATVGAVERALRRAGSAVEAGAGVAAVQRALVGKT
jgi:alanine-glyoxylate transaminase / serine-glyoxylate transaminase / serine-pyruvate transaminase